MQGAPEGQGVAETPVNPAQQFAQVPPNSVPPSRPESRPSPATVTGQFTNASATAANQNSASPYGTAPYGTAPNQNSAPSAPPAPWGPGAQRAQGGGAYPPTGVPSGPSGPGGAPEAVVAKPVNQKKLLLMIIAIAAGVIIVLGVTYTVLSSTVFSAKNAANEYLSALEAGNFDEATKLAYPKIGKKQAVLLSNAAAKGSNNKISNAKVSSIQHLSGGRESARVSYTLDGKSFSDTISLKSEGTRYLIFRDWSITSTLVKEFKISVPQVVTAFSINGKEVTDNNAAAASGGTYTFKAYPGMYEVKVGGPGYFSSKTERVLVSGKRPGKPTVLDVRTTDKLNDAINKAVKKTIDDCISSTVVTEDCSIAADSDKASGSLGNGVEYRNLHWSVTEYPQVSRINLEYEQFDMTVGILTMSIEYRYAGSSDWTTKEIDQTLLVYHAPFMIDGEKVEVEVQ